MRACCRSPTTPLRAPTIDGAGAVRRTHRLRSPAQSRRQRPARRRPRARRRDAGAHLDLRAGPRGLAMDPDGERSLSCLRSSPWNICARSTAITWWPSTTCPFEVERGEIFGLLGSNGAGKTTTVECVQGLRTPYGGRRARARQGPGAPRRRPARTHGLPAAGVTPPRPHEGVGGARPLRQSRPGRGGLDARCWSSGGSRRSAAPPSRASAAGSASGCSSPWRWSAPRRSSFSTR